MSDSQPACQLGFVHIFLIKLKLRKFNIFLTGRRLQSLDPLQSPREVHIFDISEFQAPSQASKASQAHRW